MDKLDETKTVDERKIVGKDLEAFHDVGAGGGRFDASQYAFFGRDVTQEVELGGLEDDDEDIGQLSGIDVEDVFSPSTHREEIGTFDTSSELGDVGELTSSFMMLNTVDSEREREAGFQSQLDEPGFLGKDVHDLPVDIGPSTWSDNQITENEMERKQWVQQQKHMLQKQQESEASRSSGYLQQQQWWGREASPNQNSPYSLPKSHGWSGQSQGSGMPAASLGPPASSHYRQQFPSPQMAHSMMQYGSAGQFGSSVQSGPWLQSNMAAGGLPGSVSGIVRHPLPQQNPLMPAQVMLQYQRPQGFHPPPYGQIHSQQQAFNLPPLISQSMQKPDGALGDFRDQPRGRQVPRHVGSPDGSYSGRKSTDSLPQMRSKYMTAEEIENIVRIQWAATHSSDPYIDDYYHQAMQAKVAGGTPHGRRYFSPSHLRDLPSHTRTAAEPHAFLQVDALGRIPFSSIRRPRPLLDVDAVSGSNGASDKSLESIASQRRLEQEPMLAARIAIEDGLCLLLDVDDIDRMLSVSQPPDGGVQLRRRRQILLEGLAASLQLVDPLAGSSASRDLNGRFGLAAKDDLIFLRLVSLPKGRKLVARYLRLLVPGSELVRIVAMAVFRHLRFLFGGAQSDPSASSTGLANAVAAAVRSMDLPSLSACLAAVVLASEPPPLRPIGSPSGDGATVILQAVLERATYILTDRNVQYPVQNTTVWQASFDAFFGLLSKYCTNKYESIMHSLMMSSSGNPAAISAAAAAAMSREMPIELLRASLPHTNEQQRKRLLEFAQRSIVMGGMNSPNVNDSHVSTAAVRG